MKALMDEVGFDESGAVVHMRKTAGNNTPDMPRAL
jgi:hypothetical protein